MYVLYVMYDLYIERGRGVTCPKNIKSRALRPVGHWAF